tara:strand:+ start:1321 stop:2145 length:825 start_codon:yes stop_codon:yes gene_type:complete
MKILVTGSNGFLGKNTVKYFSNRGHDVTAWSEDVLHSLPNENYDVIIPYAYRIGGRKGMDNKSLTIVRNIEIDRVTFAWAEQHCKKIIYPSSCAGYPARLQETLNTPMHEEDFGDGKMFDLYGLSKVVAETMLKKLSITGHSVRLFSIYGPNQSLDYPMPSIIQRTQQGECSVWGSGSQTRDWVHIDDALKVMEYLLDKEDPIRVNVATGKETTFKQLAQTVYKVMHSETVKVKTQTDQPEGPVHRLGSTKRLNNLGLYCDISLEEGLRKIIQC